MSYQDRYLPYGSMYSILLNGGHHAAHPYIGKKIIGAELVERAANEWDKLRLTFDDGTAILIYDSGQSCCESRYVSTDDDIGELIGQTLAYVDLKEAPNIDGADDSHEICFVEIGTLEGCITLCSHNEHNGYYGGFSLVIDALQPPSSGQRDQ